MTHELKKIIEAYQKFASKNEKCVLATVVSIDGSSYRRPGVSMLISNSGNMIGAVSGGCVEKDILRESKSVFENDRSKMMTYNGKFRLGCEGTLYILIERFAPNSNFIEAFANALQKRINFTLKSNYLRDLNNDFQLGTIMQINDQSYHFNQDAELSSFSAQETEVFARQMDPMFQLVLFGSEYDVTKLSMQAYLLGWQVIVITNPLDGHNLRNFPGAHQIIQTTADQFPTNLIDENTAAVLMTHNYAKDLNFLLAIKETKPCYLGMLGPVKRRNALLDDFITENGSINDHLLEVMHGPAGLNIGSETAEEIALSICSEIISVQRKKDASQLKDFTSEIHLTHE